MLANSLAQLYTLIVPIVYYCYYVLNDRSNFIRRVQLLNFKRWREIVLRRE